MRERIVLAPGLQNAELLSSLALHGVNSIGLRICSAGELARLALMRAGIAIETDLIGPSEEVMLVAEAVKGVAYFESASYADIQELTACLRTVRSLVTDEDERQALEQTLPNGIFEKKNAAILQVYLRYRELLYERGAMDTVSLIRKAIKECETSSAEYLILKEYPLKPLERALVERLSGGSVTETDLKTLFGAEDRAIRIESFCSCYGAPNEVETILAEIYTASRLDRCTVALSDPDTYGQLFFDYALLYDIPITFGCGIPVVNSNPARLLALYERWCGAGFFGADAFNEMLSSDAFCREALFDQFLEEGFPWATFWKILSSLRLTNSRAANEERLADLRSVTDEKTAPEAWRCLPALEIMSRELALPVEEFIKKYARLRSAGGTNAQRLVTALDRSALGALYEELKRIRSSSLAFSTEELIPQVLRMRVCRQGGGAGALHVTDIGGAFANLRENLYIAGLSASKFPGQPKENYLLLDEDLRLFGQGGEELMSESVIRQKNARLMSLVKLACSLNSKVKVSFSEMNIAELKKDNPSSLIYELCRAESGRAVGITEMEARIRKIGYFEPAISATRSVGEAYTKGLRICREAPARPEKQTAGVAPGREYSPTALEIFFACPRRFYLKYVMQIPEPEESDPFEIISATDTGTLAHALLEQLGGSALTQDEFRKLSEDSFERFLKTHPALIPENIPAAKEDFLDMMETAFQMDPHREALLKEEDVHCIHESGIRLHGLPDRVELLEDRSCLIVDFKSKRRIEHLENDIDSCLQVVIYAYLMEKSGLKVAGAEYRYIRLGETVSCRYDEEIKQQLTDKLTQFKNSLESGDFPTAKQSEDTSKGADPCRWCKYSEICGKQDGEGDES